MEELRDLVVATGEGKDFVGMCEDVRIGGQRCDARAVGSDTDIIASEYAG